MDSRGNLGPGSRYVYLCEGAGAIVAVSDAFDSSDTVELVVGMGNRWRRTADSGAQLDGAPGVAVFSGVADNGGFAVSHYLANPIDDEYGPHPVGAYRMQPDEEIDWSVTAETDIPSIPACMAI